jgi:hypothetical protein
MSLAITTQGLGPTNLQSLPWERGVELLNNVWIRDPARIQRARIVLVLALSKKSKGELVDLIMNRLDDSEIHRFCEKYLDSSDLAYIEGIKTR